MVEAPTEDDRTNQLEVLDADGYGLRLEFVQTGDRYGQRVSLLIGEAAQLLFSSQEGTDKDRWPPSPPLQQLNLQSTTDGRSLAFGVGMAGTSHWSLSAETNPLQLAIVWDVAVRVKQTDTGLGSRYRFDHSVLWQPHNGGGVRLSLHDDSARVGYLLPLPLDPLAAHNSCTVELPHLRIAPVQRPSQFPATIRWKFRLHITRPEGHI